MKDNKNVFGRIYKITNIINSKIYIGQTIRSITERWSGHKCDSIKRNRNNAISNAIRKYGADNFKIELIEDNIPYYELDNKEIYYIKEYNSITPNGYNISNGGKAFRTQEERERMRDKVLGDKNPMYGMNGELNPFFGKTHSEEVKEKLRIKHREYWDKASEEKKQENIEHLNNMRQKMIEIYGGGFKGKHHTEESKKVIKEKLKNRIFSEEHKKKISENNTKKQKVVMLNTDGKYIQTFDSMTRACAYLKENNIHNNAKSGQISNVCRGKRKTTYGYKWMYYKDYLNQETI